MNPRGKASHKIVVRLLGEALRFRANIRTYAVSSRRELNVFNQLKGYSKMMLAWDLWRSMPATKAGAPIEAPSGPGLYEVRRASNGEVVAFGHTDSVAQVLNKMVPSSSGGLLSLFSRASEAMRADLEYRTFAAASVEEARTIAARLNERRQAFYRRRMPVR